MSNGLIILIIVVAALLILSYFTAIYMRKRNEAKLRSLEEKIEELYFLPVNVDV